MVNLTLDPPPQPVNKSGPTAPRRALPLLVVILVAALAFLAGRWTAPGGLRARGGGGGREGARAPASPAPAATAAEPASPAQAAAAGQAATQPAAAAEPEPPGAAPPPPAVSPGAPRRISLMLSGPLEDDIAEAVPAEDAELSGELTQVVNRLLAWGLQVARDGRRGDRLEVVYSPPAGGDGPGASEPVVLALRYRSQKLAAPVAAYRFQAPGARWPRYYRPDGTELEERLVDTPVAEYDQITSLLRDGRHHKGVDFRVPVGTPVLATFDGVVERRNWNFTANGNCLDVRDTVTGRHAIFLHLGALPRDMIPGRRVRKGETIASSGNSGHSFAPHLHYQLEDADHRVLDPFEVQAVRRAALDAGARPAFDAERARLDAALDAR